MTEITTSMTALPKLHYGHWVLCVLIFFSCELHAASSTGTPTKTFTVLCAIPKEHESFLPTRYAYQQALGKLGYNLEWQVESPARTFHKLTHGNGDAICLTTPLTLRAFDTGIGRPLETVLGSSLVYGWSIRDDMAINEQLLIPQSDIRIGYVKNFTGDFLLRSRGFTQAVPVKDVAMAAKMLISGRLDAMILIETESFEKTLSYWLEQRKANSSKQLRHNVVTEIYYVPYLHQRHQSLGPALENALSDIITAHGGPISRKTIQQWLKASSNPSRAAQ